MRCERAFLLAAATLVSVGVLAAPLGREAAATVGVDVARDLNGNAIDRPAMGTAVHPATPSLAVGESSGQIAGGSTSHHRAAAWGLDAPRVPGAPQPPTPCRPHRSPGSGRVNHHLLASETGGYMVGGDAVAPRHGWSLGGSGAVGWASIHACSLGAVKLMTADRR